MVLPKIVRVINTVNRYPQVENRLLLENQWNPDLSLCSFLCGTPTRFRPQKDDYAWSIELTSLVPFNIIQDEKAYNRGDQRYTCPYVVRRRYKEYLPHIVSGEQNGGGEHRVSQRAQFTGRPQVSSHPIVSTSPLLLLSFSPPLL